MVANTVSETRMLSFGKAPLAWACGAVGSALPWHGRGRRFEPDQVHQTKPNKTKHRLALALRQQRADCFRLGRPYNLRAGKYATSFLTLDLVACCLTKMITGARAYKSRKTESAQEYSHGTESRSGAPTGPRIVGCAASRKAECCPQ